MTAPPRSVVASNNKLARVVMASLVTLLFAGLIAAALFVPRHHTSAAVPPAPTAGVAASSGTPESSAEPSRPSAVAQLATTSPASLPSASAVDPEKALTHDVTDSYLAFERVVNQQLSAPSADMTPLFAVAVGQALANSEDAVARLRGKGEVQRGEPTFTDVRITSTSSSGMAVVCAVEDDSSTRIVDAKTGAPVASGFPRYTARTTMVLESGVWKASIAASVSAC